MYVTSLAKIVQVVPEKTSNFPKCTIAILLLSPLGKGYGPSFKQTRIPITKTCSVESLQICLHVNILH